jgi:hypothetical protein
VAKLGTQFAVVAIVGLLLATDSVAQVGRDFRYKGSGGWGTGGQYGKMYDTKTVETVSGEVVSVTKMTPMQGMSTGVHLMLKTDKETVSVHLGPGWYLENQDVKVEPEDKIEVKGSRITFNGKPAIIAAEVRKGSEVLKLRDETGFPVWAAWKSPGDPRHRQ